MTTHDDEPKDELLSNATYAVPREPLGVFEQLEQQRQTEWAQLEKSGAAQRFYECAGRAGSPAKTRQTLDHHDIYANRYVMPSTEKPVTLMDKINAQKSGGGATPTGYGAGVVRR